MDVVGILRNVKDYIAQNQIPLFKIGFVGNGEPLLDFEALKLYIQEISAELESGLIQAYTITNGTKVTRDIVEFLAQHKVNLCFSLDGPKFIHDALRSKSFDRTMQGIELYYQVNGHHPPINATVGADVLEHAQEVIEFFTAFDSRITFSRMTGKQAISFEQYRSFIEQARQCLNIRAGDLDCSMYGGRCAAGLNNFFFANNNVYICGNCVDMPALAPALTPLAEIQTKNHNFDRRGCYHDLLVKDAIAHQSI